MVEISLTQGQTALVDDCDADLAGVGWYARKDPTKPRFPYYVTRNISLGDKRGAEALHRVILSRILGRVLARGEKVDHINGDGLDNRRTNIRLATASQNTCNADRRCDNTSGLKGVVWHKVRGKWQASLGINGKRKHLGLFKNKEDAGRAYDKAALEHHKSFAILNFPNKGI